MPLTDLQKVMLGAAGGIFYCTFINHLIDLELPNEIVFTVGGVIVGWVLHALHRDFRELE
jgi:hypothetical protein